MRAAIERIGDATLYLGDCRELLAAIGPVDAVVTDPPYGLGAKMQGGTWGAQDHNSGFLKWDLEAPHDVVAKLIGMGLPTIIWGGNYFAVPASRCWLNWDKVNAVPTMADFEQAWTNFDRPSKRKALPVGRVEFGHPTQKPLPLMDWCLGFLPTRGTVLDPFMGSGTTGVACVRDGRGFIGIEREVGYFDTACRRIEEAYRQPRLFDEPAPKPVQPSLSWMTRHEHHHPAVPAVVAIRPCRWPLAREGRSHPQTPQLGASRHDGRQGPGPAG